MLSGFNNTLNAKSNTPGYIDNLIIESKAKKLGFNPEWKALLFYKYHWYIYEKSIIDDKNFFFSPNGYKKPNEELVATLKAFYFDTLVLQKDGKKNHPFCKYPARYYWLKKHLNFDESKFPKVTCPKYDMYKRLAKYKRVSLAFSNYYMNAPASMFGHTLLVLHRPPPHKMRIHSELLDDSLSFAAFVPQMTLLYPILGLFGGYMGQFSLLPYFSKIQEYNNYESRDVWEYELNLSQQQIDKLSRIIWELGNTYLDYYYLDDNCSYLLLAILDAVNYRWNLRGKFTLFAVPADTLRAVLEVPGLYKSVKLRPSSLSRYKLRLKNLNKDEMKLLVTLINSENTKIIDDNNCPDNCKAKILDAAIEYIDFKEKLTGAKTPEKFSSLRTSILIKRAKINVLPKKTHPINSSISSPDKGHKASLIGLEFGSLLNKDTFWKFRWRPSLHDITSHPAGYSNNMQLYFFNTTFQYNKEHGFFVDKFIPLEIMSLPIPIPMINPLSWRLSWGFERVELVDDEIFNRFYFQFGMGKTIELFTPKAFAFGLITGDLGIRPNHVSMGPMLNFGLMLMPLNFFKFVILGDIRRSYKLGYVKNNYDQYNLKAESIFYLNDNSEFKIIFSKNQSHSGLSLAINRYF